MNRKIVLIYLLPLFYSCIIFTSLGCTKNKIEEKKSIEIPNKEKVIKFLSFILNVPSSVIEINYDTKSFFIPNTIFVMSIEDAENLYNNANIYKAQFENNK